MEEVYVFGDQTADCRAFFTKVFTRKDNVLLQAFLERAGEAVKVENRHRTHPSKAVPNFTTIQELVDRYYRGDLKDPAIESALVCISQFCHFIGYVKPWESSRPAVNKSPVHLRSVQQHIFHLMSMRE
jgi:hypothetical protein